MIYTTRRVFYFPSSSPLPCFPFFSISTDGQLKDKGSTQVPTCINVSSSDMSQGMKPHGTPLPCGPHTSTKAVVLLLVHGLSFAGRVFRAPWGQNAALAGYRGSTVTLGGALAPLSALSSCLSIPPSIPMSLPSERCSLPLWAPMTSLPPHDPHSLPLYPSAPLISSCHHG